MTLECETKYCHAVENFLVTYNRAFDCFNGELCMEIVEAILDRIKTSMVSTLAHKIELYT